MIPLTSVSSSPTTNWMQLYIFVRLHSVLCFSPALTLTLIYHNPGQLVNNTCLYLVAIFFVLVILHLSAVRYIFVCQQFWGDDAGSRCNILCSCNNPSGFDTVTFSFVNNYGNDAAARKYYWLLVQLCSLQYSLCCNNPSGFDTVTSTIPETMLLVAIFFVLAIIHTVTCISAFTTDLVSVSYLCVLVCSA